MPRSASAGRDRPASYSYGGYQDSTSSLDSSGTRSTHSASRNNNMIAEVSERERWKFHGNIVSNDPPLGK